PELMTTFANARMAELLGYCGAEMIGRPTSDFIFDEDLSDHLEKMQNCRLGVSETYERRFRSKDGQVLWTIVSGTPILDDDHHFIGTFAMHTDITERKHAEDMLHRLNRELHAISDCNQVLVRATDEQELLDEICRIVCEKAGYRMAWVGYAENDAAKTVRPVARAGIDGGYLDAAHIVWADTEYGRGPIGTSIRTGNTAVVQAFASDSTTSPWHEKAQERGFRSSIALPLKNESGAAFGAFTIYAQEPNAFTAEEIR